MLRRRFACDWQWRSSLRLLDAPHHCDDIGALDLVSWMRPSPGKRGTSGARRIGEQWNAAVAVVPVIARRTRPRVGMRSY